MLSNIFILHVSLTYKYYVVINMLNVAICNMQYAVYLYANI